MTKNCILNCIISVKLNLFNKRWLGLIICTNLELKFFFFLFILLCAKNVKCFSLCSCTEKEREREAMVSSWQHNGRGGPRQRSMAAKTVLKCGVFISTVQSPQLLLL